MPKRGTREARGYDYQHRKERARWAPHVARGHVDCHAIRCLYNTRRIYPGMAWDLGHNQTRTAWTGPEHRRCNRHEGAVRGNQHRDAHARRVVARPQRW